MPSRLWTRSWWSTKSKSIVKIGVPSTAISAMPLADWADTEDTLHAPAVAKGASAADGASRKADQPRSSRSTGRPARADSYMPSTTARVARPSAEPTLGGRPVRTASMKSAS